MHQKMQQQWVNFKYIRMIIQVTDQQWKATDKVDNTTLYIWQLQILLSC